MKVETFWLGRSLAVAVAATLVAGGVLVFGSGDAPARRALASYVNRLDGKLRYLRWRTSGRRLVAAQLLGLVGISAAAFLLHEWLWCGLLPLVLAAPLVLLEARASKRTGDIEAQLEGWLGAVANALKASPSLGEAIASSIQLVPAPMSQEITLVMKEYELGTPLDDAVERFAERIPSSSVAGAVLAIKVARRSGGNLPEMLENASAALRELARLEGVVRAKTAEGKAQAFVISLIPIPMVLGVRWSDPHFFDPLVSTFVGHLVIGGASVLWVGAVLLARKILAVDV